MIRRGPRAASTRCVRDRRPEAHLELMEGRALLSMAGALAPHVQPAAAAVHPAQATAPPTVVSVGRAGVHTQPRSIAITFSEPMDASRAQNIDNYVIIQATNSDVLPTGDRAVVISDRKLTRVQLTSATYDAATNTVTLTTRFRISLFKRYRLFVNATAPDGLTNTQGVFLAGVDGQPGTDYVQIFRPKDPAPVNPKR